MFASAAMAASVVKGLAVCPEGYKTGPAPEVLAWVEGSKEKLSAYGGVNPQDLAQLKKAPAGSTAFVLFLPKEDGGVAVRVNVHAPAPTPPTGGGTASTGPKVPAVPSTTAGTGAPATGGGHASTNPYPTYNGFVGTLTPAQRAEVERLVRERGKGTMTTELEVAIIEYQKMVLSYMSQYETVMYDEGLLALLTPTSVKREKELEAEVTYLKLQMTRKDEIIAEAFKASNDLISALISRGALGDPNFRELITVIREQGHLLKHQMDALQSIGAKHGVRVGAVHGDLVQRDQYNGTVINLGNRTAGSGSDLIHSQECYIESVFLPY